MNPLSRVLLHSVTVFAVASTACAATLSVTPQSLPLADTNVVTLSVTGLAAGQTILVERFHDANNNGQPDSGEFLMLSFQVTDGKVAMFGGQRDTSIPGDEDNSTNGQVRIELHLAGLAEVNRASGPTLFRVSPLDGSFTPLVQPFTVGQASEPQTVRGTITLNGAAVPGALVAALVPNGDGNDFSGGAFTDSSGNFVLNLATGDYVLLPLKPGLVTDFNTAAQVSIGAGASLTQNLALASATRAISGRLEDAVTSNGLAGVQVFAESYSGEATVTVTDVAGNFSLGVSADQWNVDISKESLRLLGYGEHEFTADTTAGDVTNKLIRLSKGRGNFDLVFFFPAGTFENGTNGSIPFPTHVDSYYALLNLHDVNFPTNVLFSGPTGSGLANTPSANFGANYDGDSAFYSSPQIHTPPYPTGGIYTVNYMGEPLDYVVPDPDVQNRQVLLVPAVTVDSQNQIQNVQWTRRDIDGNPLGVLPFMSSVEIRVDGIGGRLYETRLTPDATNHAFSQPVLWTNVASIQMVYNDMDDNQYVSFWNRGTQPLQIVTGTNLPSGAMDSPYQVLFVAAGGQTPYSWSLQQGSLPQGLNFGGTGELSGTPHAAGTYNFRVRVTDSNLSFIELDFSVIITSGSTTTRLDPLMRRPGEFEFLVHGRGGMSYTVEYSDGLNGWNWLLTTNAPSDTFNIVDRTANGQSRFYRVRQP